MSAIPRPSHVSRDNYQELAPAWLSENAARVHPALNIPARYDNQRAEFVMKDPLDDPSLRTHTDEFLEVMAIFQKRAKPKMRGSFDISKKYTWDDVIREAKDAEQKYNEEAKGVMGFGKKAIRVTGEYGSAIAPWLKLLPDGDYGSVLCGGLKLIFGAATAVSEKRGEILDALGRVPSIIDKAQRYREKCPSDDKLGEMVKDLYLAILCAIEGMIKWLVERDGWREIKALVKGPLYAQPLEAKIALVDKKVNDLEGHIRYLHFSSSLRTEAIADRTENVVGRTATAVGRAELAVNRTESAMSRTESAVNRTESSMGRTESAVGRTESAVGTLVTGFGNMEIGVDNIQANTAGTQFVVQNMEQDMRGMRSDVSTVVNTTSSMQTSLDGLNHLLNLFNDQTLSALWFKEIESMKTELKRIGSSNSVQKPSITREQLIELLGVVPEASVHDIEVSLKRGRDMKPQAQGRAEWVIRRPKFQEWFQSRKPQLLLVDGEPDSDGLARCTPMSLLSATLVHSLSALEPVIAIHFFCGLHTEAEDPLGSPSGLVRSLIVQLLFLRDFDLSFLKHRRQQEQILSHEIDHLCQLFKDLAKQLAVGTVLFCVIDGISWYEHTRWQAQLCFVVRKLRELADDKDVDVVLKVLFTSPLISRHAIHEIKPPHEHLFLPLDAEGEIQSLTQRQVMMQARRLSPSPEPGSRPGLAASHESSFGSPSPIGRKYGDYPDYDDEGYGEVDFDDGNISNDEC
ncbi:MAG: hypothetical protein M1819_005575 [Sarea resinae]|nr:MAG: hypothetical protein M1819_005575 [Sarea resinae]